MTNDIRAKMREALNNLWSRVLSMFNGLDQRVTDLEEGGGGGGGGGDVNVIEAISFNGANVPPDASKRVSMTETDPTVPNWAKASTKPAYTASEVGAIPTTGGTYTGNLIRQDANVDIRLSNNNVTARRTIKLPEVQDGGSTTDVIAGHAVQIDPNGHIAVYQRACNYVNGSFLWVRHTVDIAKDGTVTYTFTHPNEIKAALGITIPTKVSDLTNDSGFITAADVDTMGFYIDAQGYVCQQITSDTQGG